MNNIVFNSVIKDNKITVKHGRKIKAKIYIINDSKYELYINGLVWHKQTLSECHMHIIEIYSNMLFCLNLNSKIIIN